MTKKFKKIVKKLIGDVVKTCCYNVLLTNLFLNILLSEYLKEAKS